MSKYEWALNQQKLARAIGIIGEEQGEAKIKEKYISIGGKVALSEIKEVEPMDEKEPKIIEVEEAPVVETSAEEEVIAEVSWTPEIEVASEETKTSTDDTV